MEFIKEHESNNMHDSGIVWKFSRPENMNWVAYILLGAAFGQYGKILHEESTILLFLGKCFGCFLPDLTVHTSIGFVHQDLSLSSPGFYPL
mmetsp:Transcript_14279/g.20386  ORF Transcript_14279/g.20386 Transcript_14279/m.20386 type:complete len:91 (+) Transcript_14279:417-689(+)